MLRFEDRQTPQNISETVGNIPVYIGVEKLKKIAYFTILPLFTKWSNDAELSLCDLKLRLKDWVEIIPMGSGDEDVNAISKHFMVRKGNSTVPQFHTGGRPLQLYLELAYERYMDILEHQKEMEKQNVRRTFSIAYGGRNLQ